MYQNTTIAVVMPCFNEEGKIGLSVRRLKKLCKGLVDAVIVVDDGSSDNTAKEAKKAGAIVLRHATNQGAGAACRTGFYYALEKKLDVTLLMAGDDQDNPKDIQRLVSTLIDGTYQYVHGSRWAKGGKRIRHPVTRAFLTRLYSVIFSVVSGFPATDATNGMRAFKTSILTDTRIRLGQDWLNRYELEPYFFYSVVRLGYKVCEVAVTKKYHKEMKLNTKMVSFASWWSILRPLVLLPLRMKS